MANWIRCTSVTGDKLIINFDYVAVVRRHPMKSETYISMAGEGELAVKETPEQLIALGLSLATVQGPRVAGGG
jgi:hypothetical protein